MAENIVIRRITDDLVEPASEMLRSAGEPNFAGMLSDGCPYRGIVYVAVSEGRVLGLLHGWTDQDLGDKVSCDRFPLPHAWIERISVNPNNRRSGLGTALLHYFAGEAQNAGSTYVALIVNPRGDAEGRHAFFARYGLTPVSTDNADILGAPITKFCARLCPVPPDA
jgi:GNAT superfamily N-acetyltransferase